MPVEVVEEGKLRVPLEGAKLRLIGASPIALAGAKSWSCF